MQALGGGERERKKGPVDALDMDVIYSSTIRSFFGKT